MNCNCFSLFYLFLTWDRRALLCSGSQKMQNAAEAASAACIVFLLDGWHRLYEWGVRVLRLGQCFPSSIHNLRDVGAPSSLISAARTVGLSETDEGDVTECAKAFLWLSPLFTVF